MGYIGNAPYQGVLTGANIQDGTVDTADIANDAVTTVKMADVSVTAGKLHTTLDLSAKTVTLPDGSVTAAKLAPGAAVPSQTGNSGKFLTTDGTNASWGTVDLASRVAKTGDTMTGDLVMSGAKVARTFTGDGVAIQIKGSYTGNPVMFETGQSASDGYVKVGDAVGNYSRLTGYPSGESIIRGKTRFPEIPAFNAYASTNQGNSTNSSVAKIFDTEIFDNGGGYNNSTGVFTAPVSGYYQFNATTNFSSEYNPCQWLLYRNTTPLVRIYGDFTASWKPVTLSACIYLAQGDTAYVGYTGRPDYGNTWCNFSGFLVG